MAFQTLAKADFRAPERLRAAVPWLDKILDNPIISYALIGALQLKLLWNIWRFRDLTTGDTTSYFVSAHKWYTDAAVNIVWSPLYTAYYGTVLLIAHGNVYLATIFHRVGIVMAATLGILAVMRRLLPPSLALLIAAWWAVLPINFETLYEVHLFALLPVLAAWLATSVDDTPWTRGAGLAILLATTLLVRNEHIIAVIVFAAICCFRELRLSRHEAGAAFWKSRLAAYGLPVIACALLVAVFYWRSNVHYPQLSASADAKHMLNMCQTYAFGYQQRHPEWTFSAMTECKPLMKHVFGREWPTLFEMLRSNPWATAEHFLWNLSLTVNGFQVALFNTMSGSVTPDYIPVNRGVVAARVLSLLVVAILAAGVYKLVREWHVWWPGWLRDRRGILLIMIAELCVTVPVIMTQRPRPSYFFATTAIIMGAVGLSVYFLVGNKRLILAKAAAVIIVPALILFVPSHYNEQNSAKPLYTEYLRLQPFGHLMADPSNRILFGDYAGELENYLLLGGKGIRTFDYGLFSSWRAPETLDHFLEMQKINIVLIQPRFLPELKARPGARPLLANPQSLGWSKLAPQNGETDWLLLYHKPWF